MVLKKQPNKQKAQQPKETKLLQNEFFYLVTLMFYTSNNKCLQK